MTSDQILSALGELPDDMLLEARTGKARSPGRRAVRTILFAALIAMLLSVTAYAAGGSLAGWKTSLKPGWTWHSLERLPRAERKLGFSVIVPEDFENGFSFDKMALEFTDVTDDRGEVMETFPELNVHYRRGDETVYLDIMADRPQQFTGTWITREASGVTLFGKQAQYKLVPEDYQRTEEDMALQESGELTISWGGDAISYFTVSYVQFKLGDGAYSLMSMEGMELEELFMMAEEIVLRSGK